MVHPNLASGRVVLTELAVSPLPFKFPFILQVSGSPLCRAGGRGELTASAVIGAVLFVFSPFPSRMLVEPEGSGRRHRGEGDGEEKSELHEEQAVFVTDRDWNSGEAEDVHLRLEWPIALVLYASLYCCAIARTGKSTSKLGLSRNANTGEMLIYSIIGPMCLDSALRCYILTDPSMSLAQQRAQ